MISQEHKVHFAMKVTIRDTTLRVNNVQTSRFSLAAVLFCYAIFLLLIVCWQPSQEGLLWVGVFASIVAEVLLMRFQLINPLLVVTLAYALIYMLPVFMGEYQSASSTQLLISMGLAAMHIGGGIGYLIMMASKGRIIKGVSINPFKIELLPILFLGFLLVGIVVLSWVVNPSLLSDSKGANQFNVSTLDQLGLLAAMLLAPLSVLIAIHFCNQKQVSQRYLSCFSFKTNLYLVFLMLSPVLFDLLTAGRSHTVVAVLGLLVAYSVYVKRIPILKALSIAFGLMCFSALMLAMRESFRSGLDGLILAFDMVGGASSDDLLTSSVQIGHQLQILEEMINYTAANGYQYGASYLKTLINVFPLFHFMYDDTFPLSLFYRGKFAANDVLGFDFSGLAEMYLQGGGFGVFLSQILLGLALAIIYYKMLLKKNINLVLLYIGLLFGTIWWYRSDMLNLMRNVENYFIVFIVYQILCWLLVRRGRPGR